MARETRSSMATKSNAPKQGSDEPTGSQLPKNTVEECNIEISQYVFTPRTCLELLPLMDVVQIEAEIKHLKAIDASVHEKLKDQLDTDIKRSILHTSLTKSLMKQIDTVVNKYDLLLESVSRSVKTAEKKIDDAQALISQRLVEAQQQTEEMQQHHPLLATPQTVSESASEPSLEEPVKFLNFSFGDISYEEVENCFNPNKKLPGNRKASYFGSVGYSYGHRGQINHEPAEYPANNPVFTKIFSRIGEYDANFTPENYTCLVTKYENGHSSVGMHSDYEVNSPPDSMIYTVSFGATRTLRLFNTHGPLQEQHHTLQHGSAHVMTRKSQSQWKHGIMREPEAKDSRISLTFRWLVSPPPDVRTDPTIPPIPPISKTTPSAPRAPKPTRVLLLTDSIHSATPEYLFEAIPNHICIKETEFQLENIDKYSEQFAYTDVVIISMGVNDLSRYGHNAGSLTNSMTLKMNDFSRKYPKTKFIFNSILLTRDYEWCNTEIRTFNDNMYRLAQNITNLSYFDSHGILLRESSINCNRNFYETGNRSDLTERAMKNSKSNNGIHICLEIRKLIATELVKCVGYLAGCRSEKFRNCHWLYHVAYQCSSFNRNA